MEWRPWTAMCTSLAGCFLVQVLLLRTVGNRLIAPTFLPLVHVLIGVMQRPTCPVFSRVVSLVLADLRSMRARPLLPCVRVNANRQARRTTPLHSDALTSKQSSISTGSKLLGT